MTTSSLHFDAFRQAWLIDSRIHNPNALIVNADSTAKIEAFTDTVDQLPRSKELKIEDAKNYWTCFQAGYKAKDV
jgi:hypothetical protein